MNEEEYFTELESILNLAALVRRLNPTAVLAAIERAETLCPITDPTAYRNAHITLQWHKKCAQAVLQFQRAVNDIAPAHQTFPIGGKRP